MSATLAISAMRIALYEGDGSRPLPVARRVGLLRGLLAKGYKVDCIGAEGGSIECDQAHLLVLGDFPDAAPVKRIDDRGIEVRFHHLAEDAVEAVVGAVQAVENDLGTSKPGAWKPWNPVIDYDRCTNCMQCLSFCLFDVYGVSTAGKLEVQNPQNCKTHCPACSRVCPEVAIMFPKYKSGPINGDQINADDLRREHMKVDISALLGGDIYQTLRDRSAKAKSRFAKERDSDRAITERAKCLAKLKEQLDIPAEVLASINALPDLAMIEAKRAAAMQKVAPPAAPA